MRIIPVIRLHTRQGGYGAWFALLAAAFLYGGITTVRAEEETVYKEIPAIDYRQSGGYGNIWGQKAYLGTFLNDNPREMIAEFTLKDNGRFLITPQELRDIGLVGNASALDADGLIDISFLPHVTFEYNEESQTIHFRTLSDSALVPTQINMLQGRRVGYQSLLASQEEGNDLVARSDFGSLLNYTFYADSGSKHFSDLWHFQGMSGQFEGRVFGKYGTLSSNQLVRFSSGDYQDTVRLDSAWSYWDDKRLTSYTAGDFISRGLVWTRPVRMGGFQWRRNFNVRSDLVTMPLPSLSGSAAVPSSVDVYINNLRRNSAELPGGPYRINDIPLVTGANEARVVVKDALGRETVTELPFYASIDMLARGLSDFSLEAGFLRYNFGTRSDDYGDDFAASGTWRYGFRDTLTLESHGEYTKDFYNGGIGAVFNLGSFGVASVSGAASHWNGQTGEQAAIGFEMEYWGMRFNARSQRAFGRYNDLASATTRRENDPWLEISRTDDIYYDTYYLNRNRPIKALHQVSLGVPLKFDPMTLNFSYTQSEYYDTRETQLLSFSASRVFARRVFGYLTAYTDFKESNSYGIFAGLSISFDNNIQFSNSVIHDRRGTSYQTELAKYETQEIGSTGWRLRDIEGKRRSERSAYGSYRTRVARIAGSVEQGYGRARTTAEVEGAIVAAGGGVFATNRIEDSFVVVDVGAPGVMVLRENNPYGRTGRRGRLIVPDLVSYHPTKLSINADEMPLSSIAVETSKRIMPAYRTGVVARFAVEDVGQNALLAIVDESGAPLELGSLIEDREGRQLAAIGYDGQAFLPLAGESLPAQFLVKRSYGGLCQIVIPGGIALGGLNGVTQIHCIENF